MVAIASLMLYSQFAKSMAVNGLYNISKKWTTIHSIQAIIKGYVVDL
jgi:hypothetical protein